MSTFIRTEFMSVNLDQIVRFGTYQTNPPEGEERRYYIAFFGRENLADMATREKGECVAKTDYETREVMHASYDALLREINDPWVETDRVITLR